MCVQRVFLLVSFLLMGNFGVFAGTEDKPVQFHCTSTVIEPEQIMIIEGKISRVMESWPLQLTVETENGQYHVAFTSKTMIVTVKDKEIQCSSPTSNVIYPNLWIRLKGRYGHGELTMIAYEVEILR